MRIVFCGHNARGYRCLETISKNLNFDVCLVVTHPKSDQKYSHRSVYDLSRTLGYPTISPENVNSKEVLDTIREMTPDVIVLAGYGKIVKGDFLRIPHTMTVNLHGGKLPNYRGSSPINWMIINGETKGAASILEVDEGIDTGGVISYEEFDIFDNDDAKSILEKTLDIFPRLLEKTLLSIKDNNSQIKTQDNSRARYFPVRTPNDGIILWDSMTSLEVFNLVRALVDPYPNAFSFYKGTKIYITEVELYNEEKVYGIPGKVGLSKGDGVLVMCKDQAVLVKTVKFEGDLKPICARGALIRNESFSSIRTILLKGGCL